MANNDPLEKLLGMLSDEPEEPPKKITIAKQLSFGGIQAADIACTGTLDNYTREEFEAVCYDHNMRVNKSIRKYTDYLVVGTRTHSRDKIDKAKSQGVAILSEGDFEDLLAELSRLEQLPQKYK